MLAVGMTGNTLIAKSISKPTLEIAQVTHCIHSKISKKYGNKTFECIHYTNMLFIWLPHRCKNPSNCQGERRDMLRRPLSCWVVGGFRCTPRTQQVDQRLGGHTFELKTFFCYIKPFKESRIDDFDLNKWKNSERMLWMINDTRKNDGRPVHNWRLGQECPHIEFVYFEQVQMLQFGYHHELAESSQLDLVLTYFSEKSETWQGFGEKKCNPQKI